MNDRVKLPLRFCPVEMQQDLHRFNQQDWIPHFVQQNYKGDWSVIPLRGPAGAQHPVMMIYSDPTCDSFSDTPFLNRLPYFQKVLAAFDCPLTAARLMKLAPGSIIKEHKDYDLAFEEGQVRLHIPVTTNPDVSFCLNGSPVTLNEGECWYLRLSDSHSVSNHGQSDRVHLVIDAVVNVWLRDMITGS